MPRARKSASPAPKSHRVKPGETLADVAAALGVSSEQVVQANGLRHGLLAHGVVLRSQAPAAE